MKILLNALAITLISIFALANESNEMPGKATPPAIVGGSAVFTQSFNGVELKKYGTKSTGSKYDSIIRIVSASGSSCSAVVIDANYALTAAHCLMDMNLPVLPGFPIPLYEGDFTVFDNIGTSTGVKAKSVGISRRSDLGLITGNFNSFKNSPVAVNSAPSSRGNFKACGFAGGSKKVSCVDAQVNVKISFVYGEFAITGSSFFVPGMSGGPLLDTMNGYVYGVNSLVGENVCVWAPVIGALGIFGIE